MHQDISHLYGCALHHVNVHAARTQVELRRPPPHNLEAEQALLGAILVNNRALERVSDFLQARHFFDPLTSRSTRRRRSSFTPARS